jgi:hypothetical protein
MTDDDVDDLVRGAMKSLDQGVPTGYFEGLPKRALARLEESSMHSSGTSDTNLPVSSGVPPTATGAARDEDSGLHDIRELASSARMRLSSRRISTSPPTDEDLLASASGGWKAVALPEPAKMVSLPELSQLPSKAEIAAAQKAEKAAEKKPSRKSRRSGEMQAEAAAVAAATAMPEVAPVSEAPLYLDEPPAVASQPTPMPMIGSRIARQKTGNRTGILVAAGLTLAAAAGVAVYVTTQGKDDKVRTPSVASSEQPAAPARPTVQPIATDDEKPAPVEAEAAAGGAPDEPEAAPVVVAAGEPVDDPAPGKAGRREAKGARDAKKPAPSKTVIEVPGPDKKIEKKAPEPVKKDSPKEGEPDFDQLLKEAGVDAVKAPPKPKLDRNALSASDFKAGMAPVEGRAKGCYKGNEGTASLRLTIAPSGQVEKVVVSGQFAGKPEAACLEAAVRGAKFPPWDGGPQSFGYSYLLSE